MHYCIDTPTQRRHLYKLQHGVQQRAELGVVPEVLVSVPYFGSDIFDLGGLLALGEKIWR